MICILSATVDPPVPPAATETLAMAMAREQALTITDDRRAVLRAAAEEVERWTGMVLWPGSGGARECRAEMELGVGHLLLGGAGYGYSGICGDTCSRQPTLPVCPLLPNASGATYAVTSVELWDEDAEAYEAAIYKPLPGGRIMVEQAGTYEVVADLTAPTAAPGWAVEGLRRLFGYRERLRPAEDAGGGGDVAVQGTQAGAIMRSGAAEVLRVGRMRVAV